MKTDPTLSGPVASATPKAGSQRRPGRAVRLIAAAVAGAALLGAGAAGCSSPQASESVVIDKEALPSAGKLVESVLEGIAFEGGSEGAGFLFGLLFPEEDSTAPQFEKLNTKLDGISAQLVEVEAEVAAVKTEVDISEEDGALKDLRGFSNTVRDLYDNDYLPVSTAAIALAKAKEAGTDTAAAQAQLDQAKADFVAAYKQKDVGTILLNQGDYITGGGGIKSAPKLVGRVMMDKGYVSYDDSVALQRFYDALADQQAATQMMQLEYDLATNNGKYATNATNYQSVAAAATKVPVITKGHIIATPAGTASTAGATEFMTPGHTAEDGSTNQSYGAVTWPLGDREPIAGIEAANPGWKLPNDATLVVLTTAVKAAPGDTVGAKIRQAGMPNLDPKLGYQDQEQYKWSATVSGGRLWSSDQSKVRVMCGVGVGRQGAPLVYIGLDVPHAAITDGASAKPIGPRVTLIEDASEGSNVNSKTAGCLAAENKLLAVQLAGAISVSRAVASLDPVKGTEMERKASAKYSLSAGVALSKVSR